MRLNSSSSGIFEVARYPNDVHPLHSRSLTWTFAAVSLASRRAWSLIAKAPILISTTVSGWSQSRACLDVLRHHNRSICRLNPLEFSFSCKSKQTCFLNHLSSALGQFGVLPVLLRSVLGSWRSSSPPTAFSTRLDLRCSWSSVILQLWISIILVGADPEQSDSLKHESKLAQLADVSARWAYLHSGLQLCWVRASLRWILGSYSVARTCERRSREEHQVALAVQRSIQSR